MPAALARLEAEGFALRGRFDPAAPASTEEFCERRLLARIHRYTTERLRREIEPVTAQDLMRFLLRWQHVAPDTQLEGRRGLLTAIEQLQGFEIAAGSWEPAVLPARVARLPARVARRALPVGRRRLGAPRRPQRPRRGPGDAPGRRGLTPSARDAGQLPRARATWPWLLSAARGRRRPVLPGPGRHARRAGRACARGAPCSSTISSGRTGRLAVEVTDALWDLVARGLVTADGFGSVRALFSARQRWSHRAARPGAGRAPPAERPARGRRRGPLGPRAAAAADERRGRRDTRGGRGRAAPGALGRRVPRSRRARDAGRPVARDPAGRSAGSRRAARSAAAASSRASSASSTRCPRRSRRSARRAAASATGEIVRVAAVDPLNLVGILTPGPRVPAVRRHAVVYRDGAPVPASGAAPATRPAAGLGSS